jgi:integrase
METSLIKFMQSHKPKHGGIDGLTLHSLRHTAATRLVKGNLPIQMVGRILGHTQPQTTYRYLSANDETLFQAASILESVQLFEHPFAQVDLKL